MTDDLAIIKMIFIIAKKTLKTKNHYSFLNFETFQFVTLWYLIYDKYISIDKTMWHSKLLLVKSHYATNNFVNIDLTLISHMQIVRR